jgi:hypothetical protein
MSDVTKKYRTTARILWLAILLLNVVPMAVFIAKGYIEGDSAQKVKLSLLTICAIVFLVCNVLAKVHPRCATWVLLAGVSYVLNDVETLIWLMAGTTCLDEAILTPLYKYNKNKASINAEIDKRTNT